MNRHYLSSKFSPFSSDNGTNQSIPIWLQLWLMISSLLCTMDVFYTMMRPDTLRGGYLSYFIYEPWNVYSDVDLRYADENDLVTMATGRLMIIEIVMNIAALFLNYFLFKYYFYSFSARIRSSHTAVTAFSTNLLVGWKTLLYLATYISAPDGTPSYLSPTAPTWKVFVVFWIADGVWLFIPLIAVVQLWPRLAMMTQQQQNNEQLLKTKLSTPSDMSNTDQIIEDDNNDGNENMKWV